MSFAWEITDEDIAAVLNRHRVVDVETVARAAELIGQSRDRVERAALRYCDMGAQARSAMDEMEMVLFEAGIVTSRTDWQLP